ncbi:MAG: response regulator [Clostridia bacterium]|nr:response regulator [Clostridia bacterium]
MCYKVVIAEDFKMIRDVFENTVTGAEGYEVTASFATAAEAAAYCGTHRVDLVMMDVLFPGGMSGLTASEQIKAASPDTKILMVTSMPELTYVDLLLRSRRECRGAADAQHGGEQEGKRQQSGNGPFENTFCHNGIFSLNF